LKITWSLLNKIKQDFFVVGDVRFGIYGAAPVGLLSWHSIKILIYTPQPKPPSIVLHYCHIFYSTQATAAMKTTVPRAPAMVVAPPVKVAAGGRVLVVTVALEMGEARGGAAADEVVDEALLAEVDVDTVAVEVVDEALPADAVIATVTVEVAVEVVVEVEVVEHIRGPSDVAELSTSGEHGFVLSRQAFHAI